VSHVAKVKKVIHSHFNSFKRGDTVLEYNDPSVISCSVAQCKTGRYIWLCKYLYDTSEIHCGMHDCSFQSKDLERVVRFPCFNENILMIFTEVI
jgi:hypothetical protein